MLVIPADRPLDWKQPPYLTLLLILVNVLVFWLYQSGDERRWETAMNYYAESGLADQELPHYLAFRHEDGRVVGAELPGQPPDELRMELMVRLNMDTEFIKALKAEKLITAQSPHYAEWKDMRANFNKKQGKISIFAYGLIPDQASPLSFLTSAFLHGDFGHLFGNMVFLFIIGFALEGALGSLRFALTYLVAAVGGGLLHVLVHAGDLVPTVGASGAISGLMGCFAAYYGLRKIQFFYWLGFYFGYIRLPALVMLPVWIGKEVFDALTSPDSNVAYFDHIGGLLSGAAMAFLWRHIGLRPQEQPSPDMARKTEPSDYARALMLIETMKFAEAKSLLNRIIQREPSNTAALQKLYNLEKLQAGSDSYHALARGVFLMQHKRPDVDALVYDVFRDYRERAQPKARFSPDVMQLLAARFLRCGHLGEVETLVRVLSRHLPNDEATRQLQLELGREYLDRGQNERAHEHLLALEKQHPHCDQGRLATQLLNRCYPKNLS